MASSIAIVTSDGKVLTLVRPDLPVGWQPPAGCVAVLETELTPEQWAEWQPGQAQPEQVPDEVATWALREVCSQSTLRAPNLKAVIDGAIAGMAEPAKSIASGRWNSKPTIRRDAPLTLQLIAGLGLTEAEADSLFRAAAALH